jgi:zinc transporter ZupT
MTPTRRGRKPVNEPQALGPGGLRSYAAPMNAHAAPRRVSTLVAGLAIGIATVFLTSLGLIPVAVVAVSMFVVSIRNGWLDFLGGYLLGFGLVWSFLIVRMVANGATQDNDAGWVAFGLAVVVIGALLGVAARRSPDEVS